jgi:hypothetical protein
MGQTISVRCLDTDFGQDVQLTNPTGEGKGEGEDGSDTANGKGRKFIFSLALT